MTKTEALLREGRAKLDGLSARMLSGTPAFSMLARRRKMMGFETHYREVHHRFELLRAAGTAGTADLKVSLEKAWLAFRLEIGWKL